MGSRSGMCERASSSHSCIFLLAPCELATNICILLLAGCAHPRVVCMGPSGLLAKMLGPLPALATDAVIIMYAFSACEAKRVVVNELTQNDSGCNVTFSTLSKFGRICVLCFALLAAPRHSLVVPRIGAIGLLALLSVEVCSRFGSLAVAANELFAVFKAITAHGNIVFPTCQVREGPLPRTPGALEVLRRVRVLLPAAATVFQACVVFVDIVLQESTARVHLSTPPPGVPAFG